MIITNSPDISLLSFKVTWDLSGSSPKILLENLSSGDDLSNVVWSFQITSPSGTIIHEADIADPDITGEWDDFTFYSVDPQLSPAVGYAIAPWPRPFGSVEWSGASYEIYVIAKDSDGNEYETEPQTASICRPAGNNSNSKNTFGIATSDVQVKCQQARIFFQDTTYHTYKGTSGEIVSSTLKVIYPIDETETIPTPFSISNYTLALVPISYSSNNYQFIQSEVYDYDFGNDVFVRIKYQTIQTFSVWCNVDLEPLVCEFNKLIDSIQNGTCGDVTTAQNKLNLIAPKMSLLFMGIMQPLTGVDVPTLIEQIKEIGGFDCNCCSAATGIIPQFASVIDGYSFSINPTCGDISGDVEVTGTNIQFNLADVSYIVKVCNESPSETTAFSFIPSTTGCQKTYCLKIDGQQLATDILNIIVNDITLINLFNTIVNNSGGNFNLMVDGKCIQTSSACDFTFDMTNIPVNTTFALLNAIKVNAHTYPLNFSFNSTNIAALQSYLNTLGWGTFVVTYPAANEVLITSANNTNDIYALIYNISGTNYNATLTKECTGYVQVTANAIVQAIIDYLCDIDDSQVTTFADYEICYIDPDTGIKKISTVTEGETLTTFILELLARGCDTIDYIINLKSLTCFQVQNLFPANVNQMQNNDFILGTKLGQCARISPVELGTRILQLGIFNAEFMTAFCAAMEVCKGGALCEAYTNFEVSVLASSPTDDYQDMVVTFVHPSAISNTIRYARVDNTNAPIYTSVSVLPGASPYTISNVPKGQYFVGITPVYSDGRLCSESSITTDACGEIISFSAVIGGSPSGDIVVSYEATSPYIIITINYPNGGTYSQTYTADGNDINITPPSGVYGDYFVTGTPLCNIEFQFKGSPTPPNVITITPPVNSRISNAITPSIDNVTITTTDNNGSQLIFQKATIGAPGIAFFYIADGFYSSILLTTDGGGNIGSGNLVTGTGTTAGSVLDNSSILFKDVIVESGVVISLSAV